MDEPWLCYYYGHYVKGLGKFVDYAVVGAQIFIHLVCQALHFPREERENGALWMNLLWFFAWAIYQVLTLAYALGK